jgi:hypothetical protein
MVRMLAEDIVKIRYQETTSQDRRLHDCCRYSGLSSVQTSEAVIVSYDLCISVQ